MIIKSKLSGIVYTDVYLKDGVYYSRVDDGLELDEDLGTRMHTVKRRAQIGEEILIVKISTEESQVRKIRGKEIYQVGDIFEVCDLSKRKNSEAVFCDIEGIETSHPFFLEEYVVLVEEVTTEDITEINRDEETLLENESNQLYRVIAQTESLTITASMSKDMSAKDVVEVARKEFLSPKGNYRDFVVLPIASERAYKYGHISFCPRCGTNIAEEMGDTTNGTIKNDDNFTCNECNAEINVCIQVRE